MSSWTIIRVIWMYDDGGRALAGFRGSAGDCVTRAIAIASQRPYKEVYDDINQEARTDRRSKLKKSRSNARFGVWAPTVRRYLTKKGWTWVPTMQIGSGCRVHLRPNELPKGRIIVQVSRHLVAVIDGIIRDTGDPSRGGTRCVYGYWFKA